MFPHSDLADISPRLFHLAETRRCDMVCGFFVGARPASPTKCSTHRPRGKLCLTVQSTNGRCARFRIFAAMTVANPSRFSVAMSVPQPAPLPSEPLDPALLDEAQLAKLLSETSSVLRNERQDLEKAVKDISRRLKSERSKHRSIKPLIESWEAIENVIKYYHSW